MILQTIKKVAFSTKITKLDTSKQISKSLNVNQKNQLKKLQQQKYLAQMKNKQIIYQALNSFPTDSIQTISQRFKKIKKTLMNRRIYVPNRAEQLNKIDHQMIKLKQFHTLEAISTLQPLRTRSDTKQEIIQYEINRQKQLYYFSLLSNDKVIVSALLILIGIVAISQYHFFVKDPSNTKKFPNPTL